MRNLVPCLLLLIQLASSSGRAADTPLVPEHPYEILVGLNFSEDTVFTRFFKSFVERQVRDQLRNYFQALARIEVSQEHPLLDAPRGEHLVGLTIAQEDFSRKKYPDKLFLIDVAFEQGTYVVRWRQIDGQVQYVAPLRMRTTSDRHQLAKTIALAVKDDFAPVALVKPGADPKHVSLQFRDGGRRAALAAWLEEGAVLLPLYVIRQRDALSYVPVPFTMLWVEPNSKWHMATTLSGRSNPWERSARVLAFYAVKLHTQTGRVQLRVVDREKGVPLLSFLGYASDRGFDALNDKDRLPAPDRDGYVCARGSFRHVAYITLSQRRDQSFQFVLPITDDWCQSICRLPVDKSAAQRNECERVIGYCLQDLQALQGALDRQVQRINEANEQKRYEEARDQVRAAIDELTGALKTTQGGVHDARHLVREAGITDHPLLAAVEEQLAAIDQRRQRLEKLGEDLQTTIKEVDARNRAKVQAGLAGQAEDAGDIDQAIANYEAALEVWPDLPDVKQHLDQLREQWRIKSPEHQTARRFVTETLAKSGLRELEGLLSQAESALTVFQAVDDRLTARRLLRQLSERGQEVVNLIEALSSRSEESDRREAERFEKVHGKLRQLQNAILVFLQKPANAVPPAGEPSQGEKPLDPTAAEPPPQATAPASTATPDSQEPPTPQPDPKPRRPSVLDKEDPPLASQ